MLDSALDDITILNAWADTTPSPADVAELPGLRARLRKLSELPPRDAAYSRLLDTLDGKSAEVGYTF